MAGAERSRTAGGLVLLAAVLAVLAFFLVKPLLPQTAAPTPTPWRSDKTEVDVAHLADWGCVTARYTGDFSGRVKLQIAKEGGTDYNYDLDSSGAPETFAFTEGDGSYTLRVLENIEGDRYAPVFTQELQLSLADPNAPFLHPNQFVNYTSDSEAAVLAGELARGKNEIETIAAVFDYVTENLTYDEEKAATVESGYLPDVDRVLAQGEGICFDYAAVTAAMLRSQAIPCRMAVGWAGEVYHAWVEVWTPEGGEAEGVKLRAGWTRLDPTFASARDRSETIMSYIADDENYRTEYVY